MDKDNEIITVDIVENELRKAIEDMDNTPDSTDYSEVSTYTKNIENENTELVKKNKIPDRGIIKDVSSTDMVIDLALASIAKQTALKLQKLEGFLGKLEDSLYSKASLKKMSSSAKMALYTNTRLMKTDAFRMLKEIRRDVDFNKLEAQLLSMHSKDSLNNSSENEQVNSILEQIISSSSFIDKVAKEQQKKLIPNKD